MSKYEKRKSPNVSAQNYPNKIKIGNDGLEYISKPDKNNIFKWIKIKDMENCKSAKVYYMQFPENYLQKKFYKYNNLDKVKNKLLLVKKELEKKDIYLFNVGWKNVYNFSDSAWHEARKYVFKKYFKKFDVKIKTLYNIMDYSNFIFYTDKDYFWSQNSGKLYIKWFLLNNDIKQYVFNIFKKYFKNKFIEPKNKSKEIIISLI